MAVSYHRATKIVVDLKAIQANLQNEREHNQGKTVFVAVKANAYGHGAVPVAQAALAAGATGLCVATLDEALELRDSGIEAPILLLGILDIQAVPLAQAQKISVSVATFDWLEQVPDELSATAYPLLVHIAVDTGMGRIGFCSPQEVRQAVAQIERTNGLKLEGIFTHFATADQADDSYWVHQNQRFTEALAVVPHLPKYIHSSNSAASIWHQSVGNMVRYGIALYGLNPSGAALPASYPLKPALSLISELIQVKRVPAGEGIGYGKTYTTTKDEWIGTVPIGYADGYTRRMQGFHVLVEGHFCEIIGRVCMDQLMIRLPHQVKLGTKVTLIGQDGAAEITLQQVADHLQTIHYEVICLLSDRIPREYF